MAQFKNYYDLLDVAPFSPIETVKSAYRKLARKFHPDLNDGNKQAEERFKEINEAYDALNTPSKKQVYDDALRLRTQGRSASEKSGPEKSGKEKPQRKAKRPSTPSPKDKPKAKEERTSETTTTPINELFESFLKRGFTSEKRVSKKASEKKASETFSSQKTTSKKGSENKATGEPSKERFKGEKFKKTSSTSSNRRRKGEDVVVESAITPFEAEHGVVKTVNVQHNTLCKRCSGTGRVNGLVCTGCHGDKRLVRLKKLDVRIPAGVKEGSKVRVSGEGGQGVSGGEEGDLFLRIKVDINSALRIEGLDVHCDFSLTITDAVLGAEVDVPTLEGTVKMTVPPRTSSGKVFRLKNRGAKSGQSRGDQYVTVQIVSPSSLTPREKALYEELARIQQKPR